MLKEIKGLDTILTHFNSLIFASKKLLSLDKTRQDNYLFYPSTTQICLFMKIENKK